MKRRFAGEMIEYNSAEYFTPMLIIRTQKLMASVLTLREDKDLAFIPGQPPH